MKEDLAPQLNTSTPKIVWILWLQGWEDAPRVAKSCRKSWEYRNPGWRVHSIDLISLQTFLPQIVLNDIMSTSKEPEALPDQIRLELLNHHGGVWADATAMCAAPLDDWLEDRMINGFFAFSRPGQDRMISTWFLASQKGGYIVKRWRDAACAYWLGRNARDNYFWVHKLFEQVYEHDPKFRIIWEKTPQISAAHRFHFGPDSPELCGPAPDDLDDHLGAPPVPVFKLTHKFERQPDRETLFERLCNFGENGDMLTTQGKAQLPFTS